MNGDKVRKVFLRHNPALKYRPQPSGKFIAIDGHPHTKGKARAGVRDDGSLPIPPAVLCRYFSNEGAAKRRHAIATAPAAFPRSRNGQAFSYYGGPKFNLPPAINFAAQVILAGQSVLAQSVPKKIGVSDKGRCHNNHCLALGRAK
jgi:hypothetical protein